MTISLQHFFVRRDNFHDAPIGRNQQVSATKYVAALQHHTNFVSRDKTCAQA